MTVCHMWHKLTVDYPHSMGLSAAFAAVVRRIIHHARLSVPTLSRLSGVPVRTLYRVIGGEQPVSLDQAKAVADGLDTSTAELVEQAEEVLDEATPSSPDRPESSAH